MSRTWPPPGLQDFVRALPFEHLLRRRAHEEALARWRIESSACAAMRAPRITMLLDCGGDADAALDSAACWALQTWAAAPLVAVGAGAGAVAAWAGQHGLEVAIAPADGIEAALNDCGADWVVPASAGDLAHPSLAWVVAGASRKGADAVAWDWMTGSRRGRRISIERRHRAPWRDDAVELVQDRRGRAFAVPAGVWRGCRTAEAWRVRMACTPGSVHVHPEPLVNQMGGEAMRAPDPGLATVRYRSPFEPAGSWIRPAMAAQGISVVLLYRDRAELTLRAIDSALTQRFGGRLQLVLVDNQSCAQTREAIDARIRSLPPGVTATMVYFDEPFNHSRQCNLGAAAASEQVIVFLNNDVEILDPDTLDAMARWSLLPGVATVGACVVDHQGAATGGGFRCRRQPGAEFNSPVEEATGSRATRPRTTVGNTFACAAVARDTFSSLGGLDELSFPVGYNDVDFCLRARRDGWHHVNLGQHRVTHAVGASRARTDEIAQKIALRCAHPWTLVTALQEEDDEPVTLPEAILPELQ